MQRAFEMEKGDLLVLGTSDTSKTARLEIRATPIQKEMIERAASFLGESVTSFVLSTALRDAAKIVHEHRVTELSVRDWARFEAILEEDEEPKTALRKAAKRYKDQVVRSDDV